MKLLRKIWWYIDARRRVLNTLSINPLVAYPATVWVEFGGGKEIFINEGSESFLDALTKKVGEITNAIIESTTPDEGLPIDRRYYSITKTIERIRQGKLQAQQEIDYQVRQMEALLSKTTFKNGEAVL